MIEWENLTREALEIYSQPYFRFLVGWYDEEGDFQFDVGTYLPDKNGVHWHCQLSDRHLKKADFLREFEYIAKISEPR